VVGSLAVGAVLGLLLAFAPPIAGDTSITDPVWLGAMWFMRPQSLLVLVPPLLHLGIGAAVGVLGQIVPAVRTATVVLVAAAINAASTLLENAYGAGVMGVGWWLIGSAISAALMLLAAGAVQRVARSSGGRERTAPSRT
jgi:hypothetical protein